MSGHTPGPWRAHRSEYDKPDEHSGWIRGPDGEDVCCYAGCGSHDADWNPPDFTLALAAPDLLAALKQANTQMDMAAECIEAGRYDEALLHVRSMIRQRLEVIAKAEGA